MQRSHGSRVMCVADLRRVNPVSARSRTIGTMASSRQVIRSRTPRPLVFATVSCLVSPAQPLPGQNEKKSGKCDALVGCSMRAFSSAVAGSGTQTVNNTSLSKDGDRSVPANSLAPSSDFVEVPTVASASAASLTGASSYRTAELQAAAADSSRGAPRGPSSRVKESVMGKSRHGPGSSAPLLKVKKKAPWGVQQLRDSWSEDAMSKRDRENMDERLHREYRYHPDEFRRHYIRYTALLTIPCILIGMSITYYRETGRPIWKADPQHLLNLLRVMDTSPRSKLYAYRLEETEELPVHVLEYRKQHAGDRVYNERVFRLTHSAFERPSEEVMRQLELEEELKAKAAAAAGEAGLMEEATDVAADDE